MSAPVAIVDLANIEGADVASVQWNQYGWSVWLSRGQLCFYGNGKTYEAAYAGAQSEFDEALALPLTELEWARIHAQHANALVAALEYRA